jgi:RNA polymerase sigma-70 factor, ECF subfamily
VHPPVHDAIVACARESYSQLLSFVASRAGGDLASAEDALGEAFLAALRLWPEEGIPSRPEAWLLLAAKRRLIDLQRRENTRVRSAGILLHAMNLAQDAVDEGHDLHDERLKLLFICGHPAIDVSARTPLMLQTVLGMNADCIASAFLASPAAMGQRLVRAKAKIRAARIPFQVPSPEEWPERLAYVLDAIYVAFNAGFGTVGHEETGSEGFAKEAIYLSRMLLELAPKEPEVSGLLSLMLFVHSRERARRTPDGTFVPLNRQDAGQWSVPLIQEAETLLREASSLGRPGRFQIEAAIQSVHAQRAFTGRTHWFMIEGFYRILRVYTDAVGARIGHAVAIAQVRGPEEGLAELDAIPEHLVVNHQPYWVARGHLLRRLGDSAMSARAYQRAIGLTEDPAVRNFLLLEMTSEDEGLGSEGSATRE